MKVLNLVYPERSDIKYKISSFPDGQQDITLMSLPLGYLENEVVQIRSHFNSFKDLELVICAANALRLAKIKQRHLYIPYLLGARSDRKFVEGGNSYLVDIIAPQLNQTIKEWDGEVRNLFSSVTVYDVHSDVASACIDNLNVIENYNLVKFFIDYMVEKNEGSYLSPTIVSPDGGSLKKIYKLCEKVGIGNDIILCSKYRDTDGKLSKTNVPLVPSHNGKDFLIIDDICDGGRTFIEIAKVIKAHFPDVKIYLIVSHGIFSAKFDMLSEYFTSIFCTNSIKDITSETMELDKNNPFKLIQMNVF